MTTTPANNGKDCRAMPNNAARPQSENENVDVNRTRYFEVESPPISAAELNGKARQLATEKGVSRPDAVLSDALRRWRAAVAKTMKRPAYTIIQDSTLTEIAAVGPADITTLAQIPGIGPARIRDYGEAILTIVRDPSCVLVGL